MQSPWIETLAAVLSSYLLFISCFICYNLQKPWNQILQQLSTVHFQIYETTKQFEGKAHQKEISIKISNFCVLSFMILTWVALRRPQTHWWTLRTLRQEAQRQFIQPRIFILVSHIKRIFLGFKNRWKMFEVSFHWAASSWTNGRFIGRERNNNKSAFPSVFNFKRPWSPSTQRPWRFMTSHSWRKIFIYFQHKTIINKAQKLQSWFTWHKLKNWLNKKRTKSFAAVKAIKINDASTRPWKKANDHRTSGHETKSF